MSRTPPCNETLQAQNEIWVGFRDDSSHPMYQAHQLGVLIVGINMDGREAGN